ADALVKQGASVVVIEARDRVGGRTFNQPLGADEGIEVGGQWVGPTQDAILALAQQAGGDTVKTYTTGNHLVYYQRNPEPHDGPGALTIPPSPAGDLTEFLSVVLGTLEPLAQQVNLGAPWDSAGIDVRALDGQTLESWKLANLTTNGARFLLDLAVEAIFACE